MKSWRSYILGVVGIAIIVAVILFLRPEYGDLMHHGTADERVAFFTALLAVVTGILAAVSATQIFFLISADKTARLSADAAQKSADAAIKSADAAIAAQRPWLKANLSICGDVCESGTVGTAMFNFTVTNIGNSPATDIIGFIELDHFKHLSGAWMSTLKSIPDETPGYSLFPTERLSYPLTTWFPDSDWKKLKDLSEDSKRGGVAVRLITRYKFAGGEGETRKMYLLGDSGMMNISLKDLPIPAKELMLYPYTLMDSVT